MWQRLVLLCAVVFVLSCKPASTNSSGELSITARSAVAGKWLATLSIGGGVEKTATEMLARTLQQVFLSELGGSYKLAFDLSDKSGWKPKKDDVLKKFSELKASIAGFKSKNPGAPTMLVFGLTGHGLSKSTFAKISHDYIFTVDNNVDYVNKPSAYFSGVELAELFAALGADEVIVFVQSCNSGQLSNVDFMNKYAQVLAQETARRKTNIAVITPVSEVLFSPIYVIEKVMRKALTRLASAKSDVVSYATFKDAFVRAACDEPQYYPRAQIKSLAGVQASIDLLDVDTLIGIDPQFYEYIDPNLPLLLSSQGLPKWRNGTLRLPSSSPAQSAVAVTPETRAHCAAQVARNAALFEARESVRMKMLSEVESCASAKEGRDKCIENLVAKRNGPPPEPQPQPSVVPVVTPSM